MAKIVREGFFFRAVNEATGFRSSAATSASQAGLIIKCKFGAVAYAAAVDQFLSR
jgi:hypothetical protein